MKQDVMSMQRMVFVIVMTMGALTAPVAAAAADAAGAATDALSLRVTGVPIGAGLKAATESAITVTAVSTLKATGATAIVRNVKAIASDVAMVEIAASDKKSTAPSSKPPAATPVADASAPAKPTHNPQGVPYCD